MRPQAALGLKALRSRVPTGCEAHYSLLRYDALGTGQAALVVINLGMQSTVELDLGGLPPQLLGQRPTSMLCKNCPRPALTNRTLVEVGDSMYEVLVGLQLPRWVPQGYLTNCSAAYSPPSV